MNVPQMAFNAPTSIAEPEGDDFNWEAFKASVKRVRAIPYREETLCPFRTRDDWLDQPTYLRCDPRDFR